MGEARRYEISYGKLRVPVYRVHARPLEGLPPIPESAVRAVDNTLLAAEVDVEVFGENFLPAYTAGDNANVVATDSMKNVVLRQSLAYDGATLEGLLAHIGRALLETYPQMEALRVSAHRMPFAAATVPIDGGFGPSDRLFANTEGEHAVARVDFTRDGDGRPTLTHASGGLVGISLLKVTGSAFTRFVRDGYTTLPERGDRPLYIAMDTRWDYAAPADALGRDPARYVAAEQVRDVVRAVFHEMVSESIQHLVHAMGQRLLDRFPPLASVTFEARNRTPDPVAASESDPSVKVYTAPFAAYGLIKLTLRRGE